ncbi:MAG: YfiR/HmsC family protein, partial [bacterium]
RMSVRVPARGVLALGAGLLALALPALARAQGVDVNVASKIILKLLLLDQDLQRKTGGKLEIGVIGSPEAVAAFTKLKGAALDKDASVSIASVVGYDSLPTGEKPTFVFVGEGADPLLVTHYTRGNRVLSVTNVPEFVGKGVTLGIGMENDKPKVLLNLTGSDFEGMKWDPKILKISKTLR